MGLAAVKQHSKHVDAIDVRFECVNRTMILCSICSNIAHHLTLILWNIQRFAEVSTNAGRGRGKANIREVSPNSKWSPCRLRTCFELCLEVSETCECFWKLQNASDTNPGASEMISAPSEIIIKNLKMALDFDFQCFGTTSGCFWRVLNESKSRRHAYGIISGASRTILKNIEF